MFRCVSTGKPGVGEGEREPSLRLELPVAIVMSFRTCSVIGTGLPRKPSMTTQMVDITLFLCNHEGAIPAVRLCQEPGIYLSLCTCN